MALALYAAVATALLLLTHRFILPVSRVAALLLFLLPFLFTGHALVTSRVYGPIDLTYGSHPLNWMAEQYGMGAPHNGRLSDLYGQMIPWRKAVQWSLAHAEWPLWNPFMLSGDILAPAGQPAPYSPLLLLALLLPVPIGLTFSAAITHFVAALGAFLFAREIGCRQSSALIAAAGWTCATSIVFFVLWPLGAAWTWLPFVLLGVRRASLPLLTTAFTLLLLSGHPETALHVVFIAGAYALLMRSRRVLVNGVSAGLLALALSAMFILPILEAAPQTMEHATRTGQYAESPRGVPASQVWARLATDLFPYLHAREWSFGNAPLDTAAIGSIILALAIYAIWRVRSRETWFLGGLALFGFMAHAEWAPLARLLQKLPLFDAALNERFSFAAAFALATLAAVGMESASRSWRFLAVACAVIAIGNAVILRSTLVSHAPAEWGRFVMAAEIGGLALAALLAYVRAPAYLFLAIIVVQRFLSAGGIYHSFEQRAAYPPIPMFEALKDVREPFRITGHGLAFLPGTSAMYELEDVRGYQAMTFRRYRETYSTWCVHQPVWFNRVDDLTRPFLSFLNVRYAITWDRDPPPPGWREAARQPGSLLLENMEVLDRIFIPRRVRIGYDVAETLSQMNDEIDFRERAWIAATGTPHERENGRGTLKFRNTARGYVIDADMHGAGWIVTSLPAWKGWRAYVGGKGVQTQFANHAFVGVHVPQGKHRIRLVFLPRSFVIGRWITLAAIAGCCGIALVRIRRRRNASERFPHSNGL
ncbi:MAG TPA: YfhO family protein [Thermoanaerobaculia bacterium]|nr:YfhO family protein [Thermoanaerobaculia bacterium]